MTSPAPDPTGKRAKLTASRVAFWLSVTAAITFGVLKSPSTSSSTSSSPPATATGCPDSTPGAVVIHVATVTPAGIVRDTLSPPVVVCGPASLAYNLQAHPEGLVNTSSPVILAPPDSLSRTPEVHAGLLNGPDSHHWIVDSYSDTAALSREGLYGLAVDAVLASGVTLDSAQRVNNQVPIVESGDTTSTGALPVWWVTSQMYYRPARGTLARTLVNSWRNVCVAGDPVLYCSPGTASMTGDYPINAWYAGWLDNIIPRASTVLELTLLRTTGYVAPSLVPP